MAVPAYIAAIPTAKEAKDLSSCHRKIRGKDAGDNSIHRHRNRQQAKFQWVELFFQMFQSCFWFSLLFSSAFSQFLKIFSVPIRKSSPHPLWFPIHPADCRNLFPNCAEATRAALQNRFSSAVMPGVPYCCFHIRCLLQSYRLRAPQQAEAILPYDTSIISHFTVFVCFSNRASRRQFFSYSTAFRNSRIFSPKCDKVLKR